MLFAWRKFAVGYLSTDRLRHARRAMTRENFIFHGGPTPRRALPHIAARSVTEDTIRENP